MTDARRNKHHFLARHLLQQFADEDGLLVVHDRRTGWSHRRDLPERLAMERYLYAPEVSDGSGRDAKDDSMERWLAEEIDGPAAGPIAAIASGTGLSDLNSDELHAIANFVALLDMRTPAVRDLLVPAFFETGRTAATDTRLARRSLWRRGVKTSRGEVERTAQRDADRIATDLAKPAWLAYLQTTRDLARVNIKARRWSVSKAPEGSEFITSDLGIAKSLLGPLHPVPWEPGTVMGRAHWIIPLSPWYALALTPKLHPLPVDSTEMVRATNQQLLRDARRYAYARRAIGRELLDEAAGDRGTSGTQLEVP